MVRGVVDMQLTKKIIGLTKIEIEVVLDKIETWVEEVVMLALEVVKVVVNLKNDLLDKCLSFLL